jgi:hypothetical protein
MLAPKTRSRLSTTGSGTELGIKQIAARRVMTILANCYRGSVRVEDDWYRGAGCKLAGVWLYKQHTNPETFFRRQKDLQGKCWVGKARSALCSIGAV